MYYGRFPLDPWPVKALVSVLCAVLFFYALIFELDCFSPVREVHMTALLNNSCNLSILGL